MEMPHLGTHCANSLCQKLDFLPMKCDACSKIFCQDHFSYDSHSCAESYTKNNQVPVCPLCNTPIPIPPGRTADVEVGRHIDSDCQSDPAKERRKVYTNRCSKKGCKVKELVPINCGSCKANYCIKHRNESDHDCQGFQESGRAVSNAAAAAINRSTTSRGVPQSGGRAQSQPAPSQSWQSAQPARPHNTTSNVIHGPPATQGQGRVTASQFHSIQGTVSEDAALAQALAASLTVGQQQRRDQTVSEQEAADEALARALQESQQTARAEPSQSQKDSSCQVS